jgi:hypothetical protein
MTVWDSYVIWWHTTDPLVRFVCISLLAAVICAALEDLGWR